jgi:hypothetical protein
LMSMGKVYYKHLDELCPDDMQARAAANRLRTTWLKERGDAEDDAHLPHHLQYTRCSPGLVRRDR